MRSLISLIGCSPWLVACAGSMHAPAAALPSPASKQKSAELDALASVQKDDLPGTLKAAAKGTGYDECMHSLGCSYCRHDDKGWLLTSCD